jgi:hypothetical protein
LILPSAKGSAVRLPTLVNSHRFHAVPPSPYAKASFAGRLGSVIALCQGQQPFLREGISEAGDMADPTRSNLDHLG